MFTWIKPPKAPLVDATPVELTEAELKEVVGGKLTGGPPRPPGWPPLPPGPIYFQ